jgi:hypothetical protein
VLHGLFLPSGGVQQVGEVVVQRRLAVTVAQSDTQGEGGLEVALRQLPFPEALVDAAQLAFDLC